MSSLREALSSALDASDAGTLPSVAETPITPVETVVESAPITETAEAKAERIRDEGGRFAPKPAETTATPTEPRKPPSSWKKDYWDGWGKIDPTLQGYIEQRENEAASGVSTYKQKYDQVAPIHQALQPFMPSLQQRGLSPDRWLQDLGHVDRILSSGTQAEKTQLIHQMAARNGVQLGQGQGDPNLQYVLQNQQTLEQRVRAFETAQAQSEQTALNTQISQFAVDKPHFEAVRSTMGQLLQSGIADSLQTAYDKAIWMHDDTRQELVAQQAAPVNRQAEIAKKKTAASSPKSASPTGALAAGNGNKSLRDQLSEAFDGSVSGRV